MDVPLNLEEFSHFLRARVTCVYMRAAHGNEPEISECKNAEKRWVHAHAYIYYIPNIYPSFYLLIYVHIYRCILYAHKCIDVDIDR